MNSNSIDLSKVKTVSLKKRPSKVNKADFAGKLTKPVKFSDFFEAIPGILAGKNFKELAGLIIKARKKGKPVICAFGAHVLKCGLGPILIDLAERGLITAMASNGASCIHDFELASSGSTSEDVAARLKDGSFGMTKETGEFLNRAAKKAYASSRGLGYTIGAEIEGQKLPNKHLSVYAAAYRLNVPMTTHVAIGTDIIYQHPQCDGASWGGASYRDFLIFAEGVSKLGGGGVLLNFGSAVIMPEVFLKALTTVRNLGHAAFDFTTANFDMIRQYRPITNIVSRPTLEGGRGFDFTGHHEIMLPLLYAALIDRSQR